MSRSKTSVPAYATATTRAGKNRQVYEGRARRTCPGGLERKDLKRSRSGKIVSKRKSKQGKASYKKNGLHMFQI